MAIRKQPDSGASELHECANDWFRQFLKHLELFLLETGKRHGRARLLPSFFASPTARQEPRPPDKTQAYFGSVAT